MKNLSFTISLSFLMKGKLFGGAKQFPFLRSGKGKSHGVR
jgi:hypothetical protein